MKRAMCSSVDRSCACLDRRERGGRQATHFSVPSNKSRYDGQMGQKGRHAAAATHWRRLVVSGISTTLVERELASLGLL